MEKQIETGRHRTHERDISEPQRHSPRVNNFNGRRDEYPHQPNHQGRPQRQYDLSYKSRELVEVLKEMVISRPDELERILKGAGITALSLNVPYYLADGRRFMKVKFLPNVGPNQFLLSKFVEAISVAEDYRFKISSGFYSPSDEDFDCLKSVCASARDTYGNPVPPAKFSPILEACTEVISSVGKRARALEERAKRQTQRARRAQMRPQSSSKIEPDVLPSAAVEAVAPDFTSVVVQDAEKTEAQKAPPKKAKVRGSSKNQAVAPEIAESDGIDVQISDDVSATTAVTDSTAAA